MKNFFIVFLLITILNALDEPEGLKLTDIYKIK